MISRGGEIARNVGIGECAVHDLAALADKERGAALCASAELDDSTDDSLERAGLSLLPADVSATGRVHSWFLVRARLDSFPGSHAADAL